MDRELYKAFCGIGDSMKKPLDMAPISSKNQITLPKSVRQKLGVEAGGRVIFYEEGDEVLIEAVK